MLYPLMQGYDSVVIESDVELGGTDQIFNILMGRELQKAMGMSAQVAVTNPLLEGLDGVEKMSKSKGNYIGISEAPEEMYGKAMSIPDTLMQKYFVLATEVPLDEIDRLCSSDTHPRDAKANLAAAIVSRYHGPDAARAAADHFNKVFREKDLPDEIPTVTVPPDQIEDATVGIVQLLVLAGAASSNGEAKRLVKQGAVRFGHDAGDLQPVGDITDRIAPAPGLVFKVGKRRFFQLG
jgi:tyrosyl-tRNA synthetase